jgi:hypothetical protein
MRTIKLVGAALMAVVALSAIASATASAALPEFLPGSGTFTSTSGAGTLAIQGGNTITCSSDTNSGSITGPKTVTVTIDFKGCVLFGFVGAHSLEDASGVILVKATGTLCFIKQASPLQVGLKLTITPVHIEAGGQLAKVEGTLYGEVTPLNVNQTGPYKLILEQSGGLQKIKNCEGEAATELKASENEGTAKPAGETTTDTITFAAATEIMG